MPGFLPGGHCALAAGMLHWPCLDKDDWRIACGEVDVERAGTYAAG